jgi:hypothetical protein
MKKVKSNILVFGLLSTGSSALVDLLREYDNIHVIPGEFNDYRTPGLVADQLSHHLNIGFPSRIEKLTETKKVLKLIFNVLPILKIRGARSHIKASYRRVRQLILLKKLNQKLKSNISLEDKIRYAKIWINEIGNINKKNEEFVVFNQPIATPNANPIWGEVFFPWKLICVYRDPKDQFADIVKKGRLDEPYGKPYLNLAGVIIEDIYGRNRKGAINVHIESIKKRLEWVDTFKKELDQNNFLMIDFEGLVNSYDEYKAVIDNFIGDIKQHHTSKKKYFDPLNAEKSIGIYKEYLTPDEIESLKELEIWYQNAKKSNHLLYETMGLNIKFSS